MNNKNLIRLTAASLFAALTLAANLLTAQVITFESLPVPASNFFNGDTNAGTPFRDNFTITGTADNFGETEFLQLWDTNDAEFFNAYTPGFASWSGFAWSSVTDSTTSGFGNQYASFPGGGSDGAGNVAADENYAIAFGNRSYFNLPDQTRIESIDLTNTTYAGTSMRDGDSFAKKFGGVTGDEKDFLLLALTGYSERDLGGTQTGSIDFYLADYRFDDNNFDYIVDSWLTANLTSLGNAHSIGLSFTTTDVGAFGANTPLYVALDNLTLSPVGVPEPGNLWLLGIPAFCMVVLRRSRDKNQGSSRVDFNVS